MSDQTVSFEGTCYCGASRLCVAGAPLMMAYCHCHSCRMWHAAPVNAWCLWPANKVSMSGPTVHSDKTDKSHRVSCTTCGGALANIKPGRDVVVVYAMTLAGSGLTFDPAFHIFYGERVFDMADGLPKFETMPPAFGGDGARVAEPERTGWIA